MTCYLYSTNPHTNSDFTLTCQPPRGGFDKKKIKRLKPIPQGLGDGEFEKTFRNRMESVGATKINIQHLKDYSDILPITPWMKILEP